MTSPKLDATQLAWLIGAVANYIEKQRRNYSPRALPLSRTQKTALLPFFPERSVDLARVVILADERVSNPSFYSTLQMMGFDHQALPDFANMLAITFVETVVAHGICTVPTLFHELVHVLQYEKLGLTTFAEKYVKGFLGGGTYMSIPLEQNAYELEARFQQQPQRPFSVEAEIDAWIAERRL